MILGTDYSSWSIGKQLQIMLVLSYLFLVMTLILTTNYLLDWLENSMINASKLSLDDFLHTQMHNLASLQSKFILSEFNNYITMMQIVKVIHLQALGYPPHKSHFHKKYPYQNSGLVKNAITYTHGSFFSSSYKNSPEGDATASNLSALDPVMQIIYLDDYLTLYSGMKVDHFLYIYPGVYINQSTYTPLVREWYYLAQESANNTIVTEPYHDLGTDYWIFTVSEALLKNNTFKGVVAVDILLADLTQKVSSTVISETGFNLLISPGGVIINLPSVWAASANGEIIKIYTTFITGITPSDWEAISNSCDGRFFSFIDGNGANYELIKKSISIPYTNQFYHLLIVASQYENQQQLTVIQDKFSKDNNLIWFTIITVGIFMLFIMVISICLLSRSLQKNIYRIEKIFLYLIRKALFPKISKTLNIEKIRLKCSGIKNLINSVKEKLNKFEETENIYSPYLWNTTRPSDKFLYLSWSKTNYPHNKYAGLDMRWKLILSKLNQLH